MLLKRFQLVDSELVKLIRLAEQEVILRRRQAGEEDQEVSRF